MLLSEGGTNLVEMASRKKRKKWDFFGASKRHYDDAMLLMAGVRLANAAQLFGLSAECGVKVIIEKIHNPLPDKLLKHANVLVNLLPNLQVSVNGRQEATYLAMVTQFKAFGNWHVDHRYQSETNIPLTQHLKNWAMASREVQLMLQKAQLDGVIQ